MALVLVGVLLNFVPGGLTRASWIAASLVFGLAVLYWRRGSPTRLPVRWSQLLSRRLIAAGLISVGLLAVSVGVSLNGTQAGVRVQIVSLSLVSQSPTRIVVRISSSRDDGTYRLVLAGRGKQVRTISEIRVLGGSSVDESFAVSPGLVWQFLLTSAKDPAFSRLLIVNSPR